MGKAVYIRTDRNGTKIYHDYTCERCGGLGGCDKWAYTGWTCYDCGGTGETTKPQIIKVYTEEYRAKLDARNKKRAEEKRKKRAEEFRSNLQEHIQKKGFNSEGKIYIVIGDTYSIKDEIREAGGKWNPTPFGTWVFTERPNDFETIELEADECLIYHFEDGWIDWKSDIQETIKSKMPEDKIDGEYVGSVGERICADVTFVRRYTYERPSFRGWGTDTIGINIFKDDAGNCIVWKSTSAFFPADNGSRVKLKGTVKEHSEYKGEKQTLLQRCKVEVIS